MHISATTILSLLFLANVGLAVDCNKTSYTACDDKIVHFYDLDTGEVCDRLDCGGGRAPPKYNEPCCGAYTGTKACVKTKSTLSCFQANTPSTSAAASPPSNTSGATTTTSAGQSSSAQTGSGSGQSPPEQTGASRTTNLANGGQTTPAPTQSGASSATSGAATTTPATGAAAGQFGQAMRAVVGVALGAALVV